MIVGAQSLIEDLVSGFLIRGMAVVAVEARATESRRISVWPDVDERPGRQPA